MFIPISWVAKWFWVDVGSGGGGPVTGGWCGIMWDPRGKAGWEPGPPCAESTSWFTGGPTEQILYFKTVIGYGITQTSTSQQLLL